jgi:multicomponent K+:H+ antiporter subunit A
MLVLGIGTLVVLYARYYMSPAAIRCRASSRFFLAFMGAMLGVVLSGNLVQLVFFWELTSLFSFLLIGYWHHRKDARRGARMALTVTGTAAWRCWPACCCSATSWAATTSTHVLAAASRSARTRCTSGPGCWCCWARSPRARSSRFTSGCRTPWPRPRRCRPTCTRPPWSRPACSCWRGCGRCWRARELVLDGRRRRSGTLLLGAYPGDVPERPEGLLAYSTISHLGLITLLLGLNSPLAAVAAVFHIMNHATFKASLFMAAGIIDHETGTRDMRRLSGLWRPCRSPPRWPSWPAPPWRACRCSTASCPRRCSSPRPCTWAAPGGGCRPAHRATLAGIFAVVYSLRFTVDVFFGPPATDLPLRPHEPPHWMRVPVEVLVLVCLLVVGMLPQWSIGAALELAARPVVGGAMPVYSLAIWHGVNKPLLMSLVALAGGVALFLWGRRRLTAGRAGVMRCRPGWTGSACFSACCWAWTRPAAARSDAEHAAPATADAGGRAGGHRAGGAALWPTGMAGATARACPATPAFALLWVLGGMRRPGHGAPGQVPPAGGARHAGRRWAWR